MGNIVQSTASTEHFNFYGAVQRVCRISAPSYVAFQLQTSIYLYVVHGQVFVRWWTKLITVSSQTFRVRVYSDLGMFRPDTAAYHPSQYLKPMHNVPWVRKIYQLVELYVYYILIELSIDFTSSQATDRISKVWH